MEDLNQSIQDLSDRQDDFESNVGDTTDQIQSQVDDHTQQISDVAEKAGQLDFPLNENSIVRIKEVFPTGSATLSGGSVTVTDSRIGVNSVIQFSPTAFSGTRGGISYAVSAGQVVFTSTSATEASTLSYVIF